MENENDHNYNQGKGHKPHATFTDIAIVLLVIAAATIVLSLLKC